MSCCDIEKSHFYSIPTFLLAAYVSNLFIDFVCAEYFAFSGCGYLIQQLFSVLQKCLLTFECFKIGQNRPCIEIYKLWTCDIRLLYLYTLFINASILNLPSMDKSQKMTLNQLVQLPAILGQHNAHKTGVINDPLGQAHSLANSEHCFHLKFVLF